MFQDMGFDVPLDAFGLVALVSPFLDPARDVTRQAVKGSDFAHIDSIPPGFSPADKENAVAPILFKDGREWPDVEILINDKPIPGAMGEE